MISLDAMPIILANGKGIAWVDRQDHEFCSTFKWYLLPGKGSATSYARTDRPARKDGQRGESLLLHLLVASRAGIRVAPHVDHADRNGLNCTRENLRTADRSQNAANADKSGKNTSGYRGVVFMRRKGRWMAQIKAGTRHRYLGEFDSPETAARVYDEWAKAGHGAFAILNFPPGAKP